MKRLARGLMAAVVGAAELAMGATLAGAWTEWPIRSLGADEMTKRPRVPDRLQKRKLS